LPDIVENVFGDGPFRSSGCLDASRRRCAGRGLIVFGDPLVYFGRRVFCGFSGWRVLADGSPSRAEASSDARLPTVRGRPQTVRYDERFRRMRVLPPEIEPARLRPESGDPVPGPGVTGATKPRGMNDA